MAASATTHPGPGTTGRGHGRRGGGLTYRKPLQGRARANTRLATGISNVRARLTLISPTNGTFPLVQYGSHCIVPPAFAGAGFAGAGFSGGFWQQSHLSQSTACSTGGVTNYARRGQRGCSAGGSTGAAHGVRIEAGRRGSRQGTHRRDSPYTHLPCGRRRLSRGSC